MAKVRTKRAKLKRKIYTQRPIPPFRDQLRQALTEEVQDQINQLMDAISKEMVPLVIVALMQQPELLLRMYEAAEKDQRKRSEAEEAVGAEAIGNSSLVESLYDTVFRETEALM